MHTPTLAVAAVLILPAFLSAQLELPTLEAFAIPLGVAPATTYRRAMPARIGDDPELDVVVLDTGGPGKRVLYMPNPARHNVVCEVALEVNDAAVLPGAGPGGRDAIATVCAAGLQLYDAAIGEQLTSPGALHAHADWLGAQRIWTARDAAGVPLVFALDAGGTTIARWRWVPGAPERLDPIGTAMNAVEVLTLQYDGNGEVEIAVQIGNLVFVLDWNLQVAAWFEFTETAPGGNQNFIAVSRGDNTSAAKRDHLVAYGYREGQFQLLVLTAGSAAFVPLGNGDAASGIAAFDDNGDGFDEIAIANGTHSRFQIVGRDPATGAFVPTPVSHVLVAGPLRPDGPVAALCGGDFDGDGDGDVVGFQSADDYMHVALGDAAPEARLAVLDVVLESGVVMEGGVPSLRLHMFAELPPNLSSLVGQDETAYVDIVGWVRPSDSQPIEASASILVRVPAAAPLDSIVVTLPNTTADPSKWSVVLHGRLVMVGPDDERRLPVRPRFYSPDALQMHACRHLATVCRFGGLIWPGTGGEGNTTDPSGGGRPPNEPPRP